MVCCVLDPSSSFDLSRSFVLSCFARSTVRRSFFAVFVLSSLLPPIMPIEPSQPRPPVLLPVSQCVCWASASWDVGCSSTAVLGRNRGWWRRWFVSEAVTGRSSLFRFSLDGVFRSDRLLSYQVCPGFNAPTPPATQASAPLPRHLLLITHDYAAFLPSSSMRCEVGYWGWWC